MIVKCLLIATEISSTQLRLSIDCRFVGISKSQDNERSERALRQLTKFQIPFRLSLTYHPNFTGSNPAAALTTEPIYLETCAAAFPVECAGRRRPGLIVYASSWRDRPPDQYREQCGHLEPALCRVIGLQPRQQPARAPGGGSRQQLSPTARYRPLKTPLQPASSSSSAHPALMALLCWLSKAESPFRQANGCWLVSF